MTAPAPAPPLLRARGLRIERDGAFALEVAALDVGEGEVLALLGPNGAGKSTLLLALAGILPAAAGELALAGGAARPRSLQWRREVTLVFQEALLLRDTVRGNVAAGLRFRGLRAAERDRRVAEALDLLGIAHLAARPARALSGGEAQRVSLARALACRPRLLLLDEPFAALDQPSREALVTDFAGVVAATGTAAVFATHDRIEALRLAGRTAVLAVGRIEQLGPTGEVLARPATRETAVFLGVENLLAVRAARGAGGRPAVSVGASLLECLEAPEGGGDLLACVRPEHVGLLPAEPGTDAPNCLPARVAALTPLGPLWRVSLEAGVPLVAFASPGLVHGLGLAPGAAVLAHLPPEAIHLIPAPRP